MKSNLLMIFIILSSHNLYASLGIFSQKPKGKPSVNFSGTIKTSDGQTIEVENITISGKFEDIDLYKQPKSQKTDPKSFALFPDLADLQEIKVSKGLFTYQPPKTPKSKKLPPAKKHNQLTLVYKNGTTQKVLIPHKRRLWADQRIDGKLVEQKISFDALRHIALKESKTRSEKKQPRKPKKAINHSFPTESDTIKLNAIQATIIRIGHIFTQLATASKQQYDDLKDTLEQLFTDLKDSFDRAFS